MADFINIPEGARTDSLHRLGCSIFNHMSKDDGMRILAGVNLTYEPPLTQSEFDYQISRAWEFVQANPKKKPPEPEVAVPHQDRLVLKSGIPSLDAILGGFHSGEDILSVAKKNAAKRV